jgi:hypothetical protein
MTLVCRESQAIQKSTHILQSWSRGLPRMEDGMLAEIFMLRLEALARIPQGATSKSTSEFVPISPVAPDEAEEGTLGLATAISEPTSHQD